MGKKRKSKHTTLSHVIFRDGKRRYLGRKVGSTRQTVYVIPDWSSMEGQEEVLSIDPDDVLADLGEAPEFGRVYNVWAEPFRRTVDSDWGTIRVFRKIPYNHTMALQAALSNVLILMAHQGLPLKRLFPIYIELRHQYGQYAGVYQWYSHDQDIMVLRPEHFASQESNEQIIAHEIGHGVWYNLVPEHRKAQWIRLYHRLHDVSDKTRGTMKKLYKKLNKVEDSLRTFRYGLTDDEEMIFDLWLEYCYRTWSLSTRNMEAILVNDGISADLWPKNPVELVDIPVTMTEYANKNPEEFFAEAWRLYLLPHNDLIFLVQDEMSVTIKEIVGEGNRPRAY